MAIALLLAGCGSDGGDSAGSSGTSVKLFLSTGQASWPFHVADKKGFFADNDLDVEIQSFQSGGDAATSFVAQKADVMQVGDLPTVLFLAKNEAKIVADTDHHNGVILVAKKGSDDAGDLKKIAANLQGSEGYWVDRYVTDAGTKSSTEIINLAPDAGASALINGEVSAVLSTSSRLGPLLATSDEFHILEKWPSANFLIVSTSFADGNPDAVGRILRLLAQAWDFIQSDTAEAAQIQATAEGLKPDVPEEWLSGGYDLSFAPQFGKLEYDMLTEMSQWAVTEGRADKPLEVCDVTDLRGLEDAVPDGVTDNPCRAG